jgi:glycosyltransferase involved in cell wall biosynthesis
MLNALFVDEHHARIEPVPEGVQRPHWSVLIPCYNCARFLESALASVLSQDPGPSHMEIMVIDDCSEHDDPGSVVERVGQGRVGFVRQKANVGKVRNYETGLRASRGQLIHQLHGDDLVLPGFYREMQTTFDRFRQAAAFFCESDYIDEEGRVTGRTGREQEQTGLLENWLPKIVGAQRIQTPSMVVRREIYETLGGFDRRLDCSEDWEMWIRVSNFYPVGFCAGARAQYRTSAENNSTLSIIRGTRGRVQRRMFGIVDSYLPKALQTSVRKQRALEQALYFSSHIPRVIQHSGVRGWFRLCLEALRFDCRPAVLRRIASLTWRHVHAGIRKGEGKKPNSHD